MVDWCVLAKAKIDSRRFLPCRKWTPCWQIPQFSKARLLHETSQFLSYSIKKYYRGKNNTTHNSHCNRNTSAEWIWLKGCQFTTSDQIFEIIFGRLGKGRFNLKGATGSFAREFVDFKACTQNIAQGKTKTKIRHIKVNTQRKEKSLLHYHADVHSHMIAACKTKSVGKTKPEKVKRI